MNLLWVHVGLNRWACRRGCVINNKGVGVDALAST